MVFYLSILFASTVFYRIYGFTITQSIVFPKKRDFNYVHGFSLDFYDILFFREVEAEVQFLTHDVI